MILRLCLTCWMAAVCSFGLIVELIRPQGTEWPLLLAFALGAVLMTALTWYQMLRMARIVGGDRN